MAALQGPINGRLGHSVGVLVASTSSFLSGLVVLVIASVCVSGVGSVAGLPRRLSGVSLVDLAGGLIGGTYVLVAVLTVDDLGAGGLAAASVAGTLLGAVLIDWRGFVGVRRRVPTARTWFGVALLLVATAVISGGEAKGLEVLPATCALLAGILVAFQPPVNSRLALRVGGLGAAVAQTCVGCLYLFVISAVVLIFGHDGGSGAPVPWWALLGGPLGAVYVMATLKAVPVIGAAGVAAATIAGGLLFGIAADALGILDLTVVTIGVGRLGGVAMLAAGAGLVLWPLGHEGGP
ncbi:MAG: hypothetical protein F2799_00495 [Actinobacteria bacterium]|nr:hypothetical protein [Actinomycetota bacterium]